MTEDHIEYITVSEEMILQGDNLLEMQIRYSIANMRSNGYNVDRIEEVPRNELPEYYIWTGATQYKLYCTKLKNPLVPCTFGKARLDIDQPA